MINNILSLSIERRGLMLSMIFLIIGLGIWSFQKLPIDAVPDITNVQVQINTRAPGYSPLESEQRITYPIERAIAGLPDLDYTRSISRYGLSQVTVIFEEGTDLYFARNLINNRLAVIKGSLPQGIEPEMGPIATGLGEIVMYTITAEPDARQPDGSSYDPTDLRVLQDWVIQPRLERVKGVTEVNVNGGYQKQFHVQPDPAKLLNFGVSLSDLKQALMQNNDNRGAGYIERYGQQILVRSPGQLKSIDDIGQVVVKNIDDRPVLVKDVADVVIGKPLRSGAGTRDGKETVVGTVMMLFGENSREVAATVTREMAEIQSSLPEGVILEAVYDRTTLVDKAVATVEKNLLEGALLVIVVLFLLLGNIRAALITAAVIPLSMMATITGMVQAGISANLMSMGALDFGLIVDGAVIIVENSIRRLSMAQKQNGGVLPVKERLNVVYEATNEVIRPSLFGVMIITIVYIPLFSLTGVEGKMFEPMAATVVIALLSAMVFTLTIVPAAIAMFMGGRITEKESFIISGAKWLYRPVLLLSLKLRWLLMLLAVVLVALSVNMASKMGSEFIPQLNEGDIALHALRTIGTSLEQSIKMQEQLEQRLKTFPQVDKVIAKIGTPEVATDPMPPNVADTFLILKPRSEWPDPELPKSELLAEIEAAVTQLPGNNYEFTQPIEMRFNELISGVRADLGIKVFGDDLDLIKQNAEAVLAVIQEIPGAADARLEQVDDMPMLTIEPKRMAMSRYGLNVDDLQNMLSTAVGGGEVGLIYDGDRRFDLVVRLPEEIRQDIPALSNLPVSLPGGDYVPLSEVATIELTEAPSQISRENAKRRVVVTSNVRGRDLGSFVEEAQQRIAEQVQLPPGYWIEYGGTYEQLQSASQRLSIVVPVTLVIIMGLLITLFGSFRDAAIIFTGVPLALTGGVLALWLRDMPLSISAGVGFIALSGVAVLNGLVMLSFIRDYWHRHGDLHKAIVDGAMTRLRPVLMTALVASLGFVPMALNTGTGAEVQRPLATVVIGGIISSTLLTLVVLPALYRIVHGRGKSR
ncbi:MAG TPA: CusA/CzcA family heavy metal efflux RND transporter [Methylophaga aminisulfidivorans]|jgi:cobalt-zinc-cadmium resistance protein CzcA|uniref:CusA/CzcA family heavy metal efflux RND transporter n=5 Tax=root TaxID=1 RepID=A0A7C2AHW0_9GAMM|nr:MULTISPECIES: CusA/CzcA family heavy metal efflux RND transporter [unclassified Methylophaga]HEC74531.1 CusA/CzcA family heavy metal efflux RND transporter [Methylophaga aminisulfidivorans]MAL48233.1 CusA/CzcA family heavy metal efflux RND transporter [Methylophaga sp.]MAP25326.1 CusA/CzcA family heavy metal efflux RND transporter [Methylophaga sp.]MBN45296.1 CusA/CzcA family heavy metal efflux RND transporter [Methylophaga sp.]MBP26354.1 CusA/CzcA family heavy metal efflux RND transporter |tara:strand:- start:2550 stop:5663 length:3114 start_codon:yes stop_codon:yes gene_type:complete